MKFRTTTTFVLTAFLLLEVFAADEKLAEDAFSNGRYAGKVEEEGHLDGDEAAAVLSKPLYEDKECAADIEAVLVSRRCSPVEQYKRNNFALIACLSNAVPRRPPPPQPQGNRMDASPSTAVVSAQCEHVIWKYKVAITNNANFLSEIVAVCPDNMKQLESCSSAGKGYAASPITRNGHILSCVIEKKNEAEENARGRFTEACAARITQVESVVFSDYRLIGDFVDKCSEDIEAQTCGRIVDTMGGEQNYHSQVRIRENVRLLRNTAFK